MRNLGTIMWSLLLAWAAACAGCGTGPASRFEFTRLCMGVQARVVLYARDEERASALAARAFERLAELDAVMSDYRPDSEVSRLATLPAGTPAAISGDLALVLSAALEIAERTGGAYDPTLGDLSRAWRRARDEGVPPDERASAELVEAAGWSRVTLRDRTLTWTMPRLSLDLGGIGKGFAAQEAVKVLRGAGAPRAMVSLAGDIAVGESPPGTEGWRIAVQPGLGAAAPTLLLRNACVSTSGDSAQFVVFGGVRYSHILDPRTGLGLVRPAAATVVAPDGRTADALATALCVLGIEEGRRVLRHFPEAHAIIVEEGQDGPRHFETIGLPLSP